MPLIVQKFGGTSVANAGKIFAAARRAIQAHRQGQRVCVVVSARGHTTDELVELAKEVSPHPPAREMDMLLSTGEQISVALMAMAIQELGVPAISFTGGQIGLVTDSFHTKARIKNIDTKRMLDELGRGRIVIVAGFQGIDEDYNITTLGRGGSDTTAVALAAVLGADVCEIYTDVDGVFTTDPRIVPEARKIDRISYDEMLELASLGAGVMHNRSIEFAKKYGVPIHVRNSTSDAPGTWIVGELDARRLGHAVTGAALAKDEARVTLLGVPDQPGIVHRIVKGIAKSNIVLDMIVQDAATDGKAEVSFTVATGDLAQTLLAAEAAAKDVGAEGVTHDASVAKVSVVGTGMRTHTGVAAEMFEALAKAGVNIQMITTSEIKISALIAREQAATALRAIHAAFDLERPAHDRPEDYVPRRQASMRGVEITDAPPASGGMEDIVISGVELDERQGRVTIHGVPDQPGFAAKLFRVIAEDQGNVDMIVQNAGVGGNTNLSFTVAREEVERAVRSVKRVHAGEVSVEPSFAKLSALGLGMRSHADVAERMFGALAARGINIALINTSEVRVNVTTALSRGGEALEALREAFDLHENGNGS